WSYTTAATLVWNDDTEARVPPLDSDTLVPGLAENGRVEVEAVSAERGELRDSDDEPTPDQRPVQKNGIDKAQLFAGLSADSDDEPITKDRPVQKIGIDKAQLFDDLSAEGEDQSDAEIDEALTDSATELAELLELDTETYVDRTVNAGEQAWVEFIVLRDDD